MTRAVRVTFTVDVPVIDGDDDPVATATSLFLEGWAETDLPLRDLRVGAVDE